MQISRCSVLFIDDHEDTAEMLKLLLSHEEYEDYESDSLKNSNVHVAEDRPARASGQSGYMEPPA